MDAFAEYERLIIKARTKAALAAKRARGERTGQVPYGERLAGDGRTLEPDATEAAAVGLVRELKAAGMSLRAIARELNRRGVPTKSGRPWRHTTIRDLLGRPTDEPAAKPAPPRETLSEQRLRRAIRARGMSLSALAEESGVDRALAVRRRHADHHHRDGRSPGRGAQAPVCPGR